MLTHLPVLATGASEAGAGGALAQQEPLRGLRVGAFLPGPAFLYSAHPGPSQRSHVLLLCLIVQQL